MDVYIILCVDCGGFCVYLLRIIFRGVGGGSS